MKIVGMFLLGIMLGLARVVEWECNAARRYFKFMNSFSKSINFNASELFDALDCIAYVFIFYTVFGFAVFALGKEVIYFVGRYASGYELYVYVVAGIICGLSILVCLYNLAARRVDNDAIAYLAAIPLMPFIGLYITILIFTKTTLGLTALSLKVAFVIFSKGILYPVCLIISVLFYYVMISSFQEIALSFIDFLTKNLTHLSLGLVVLSSVGLIMSLIIVMMIQKVQFKY